MSFFISVIRYQPQSKALWNQLIAKGENATFLFDRDFMDYHADRFTDHSLMLFVDNELLAAFPANESGNTIYSHQGLTYGSLAFKKTDFSEELRSQYFNSILEYYRKQGFKTLIYKEIPPFYQTSSLPTLAAVDTLPTVPKTFHQDIGAVIDLRGDFHFSYLRKRSIKKATANELLTIKNAQNQGSGLEKFWNELLIPNLKNKYNLQPTHTLEEITLLANRFPKHIKLFSVYFQNEMVAGTVIFEDRQVAHCQYIASNDLGKQLKATDLLFNFLITQQYKNFKYFSFGISNWHGTSTINQNLLTWKLSWGAKVCEHLHFKLEI